MRRIVILIHLFIASFIAPAFILLAVSGGLYLIGIKGQVTATQITVPADARLDFSAPTLQADVDALLLKLGIQQDYEYLKVRASQVVTRPTSRTYLEFKQNDNGVLSLSRNEPDLQKSMIELHKGHGPTIFKTYQKFVAVGLLVIVLSGLIAGLNSPAWRRKTIVTSVLGLLVFVILAFA